MNRGKLFVRTGVALAAAGIGGLVLVQPAAAHATGFSKTRSGCHYSGGVNSAHSFAWTQKDSGGCSGHAWLRVTFTDGSSSGDVHSAGRAEVYGPIRCAWHKTQANEGEPALMTAVQRCVTGAGVALSGREDNPADLLAAVPENRQQILRDCVRTSLASIYPKLFSTSFP